MNYDVSELTQAINYVACLRSPLWMKVETTWRLIETDCGAMILRGEGDTPAEAVVAAWRER